PSRLRGGRALTRPPRRGDRDRRRPALRPPRPLPAAQIPPHLAQPVRRRRRAGALPEAPGAAGSSLRAAAALHGHPTHTIIGRRTAPRARAALVAGRIAHQPPICPTVGSADTRKPVRVRHSRATVTPPSRFQWGAVKSGTSACATSSPLTRDAESLR